jgi:RimJ/RimL family protein N-acetyltransferase
MSSEIPQHWIKDVILRDGTRVLFRPEKPSDLDMLKAMFLNLSENTMRLLSRPIIEERIEGWISNLDYKKALPIVAITIDPQGQERIISVASLDFYSSDDLKHKTEFGVTVHDDYQNRGLGTILTNHMIDNARQMGLKKVYLRVVTENDRAIHVYKKCGFHIEGELKMEYWNYVTGEYGDDYQMAIFL